jgi:enoyl-CoA hydratase
MLSMAEIRSRVDGPVVTVTLSQPNRLNALSFEMWKALPRALHEAEEREETRVLIVDGDGGAAFSSGADIARFASERTDPRDAEHYSDAVSDALRALTGLRKPAVARVHGVCSGGGAAIALACHIRIASDKLRFGIPAGRLGIVYEFEAVQQLVEAVGSGFAYDLLASGRTVEAEEASRLGLVNHVVPAAELDEHVDAYAAAIADNAPLAVEGAIVAVRAALAGGDEHLEQRLRGLQAKAIESADYAEGVSAFIEKRRPSFSGL